MNSNAKEEMNPIKEKYKATIIIPAYNAETTIHRAVDSAVNQTTKGDVTKFIPTKRALPRIIWSGAEPFVL